MYVSMSVVKQPRFFRWTFAPIFTVIHEESIYSVEVVGKKLLQNVLNSSPLYMAPCDRSLEWSLTPL
jgi:hypothetical protein